MGLIDPVEQIDLPQVRSMGPVHFIAIGGSGMNGIASALVQLGVEVSGSDRQDSDYLRALERLGARVHVGHAAAQLGDAQTVVASSAIREDNPEMAEARRRGLRVVHRSVALGSLMLGRRGVAVAGTHGKTTTTAMLAQVLSGCGLDPSFVIGGALTGSKTGGHLGGGDLLVVEADESDGSFLQYPAEIAVVTNVDPDHLVNWGTPENYADGFLRFALSRHLKLLVVSADDQGAVTLTRRLRALAELDQDPAPATTLTILTFGVDPDADVRIVEPTFAGTGSTFGLVTRAGGGPVELSVPAHYNVLNAAAAYAVATWLGVDEAEVRTQLSGFGGTHRRFELIDTVDDIRVFDDYAHHPTEVANTLQAARTGVGQGRVVVCFQPHLYTRTRDFAPELAAALELADQAIVMDVCGDREDPIDGIDGALVAKAIASPTTHVTYEAGWDAVPAVVASIARPGDLVITVGCGDVTQIAPLIVAELHQRSRAQRSSP